MMGVNHILIRDAQSENAALVAVAEAATEQSADTIGVPLMKALANLAAIQGKANQ